MKRYIVTFLTFAISFHFTMAQVTGKVIDSKSREALDYVNVYYAGKSTYS